MKIAFSIVAKNYIGLAKVLEKSIKKNNSDVEFFIFVADENCPEYMGEDSVIFAKEVLGIPASKWQEMSFKYTLTEFCTAIKPYCFKYLFDKIGASKVIYFDPDIYVFNSLSYFYDKLDEVSVILVPHIAQPYIGNNSDREFLQAGIYNLGFLALKNSKTSGLLLDWWGAKLQDSCFDDVLDYTFTDQKWMNFVPALFPSEEVFVSRHLGANIAPWNFYERNIILKEGVPYEVSSRLCNGKSSPILFIHYSGFNYKSLLFGTVTRTRFGVCDIKYDDVAASLTFYIEQISSSKEEMLRYFSLPYTYGVYDNGVVIDKVHRRLFRALIQRESVGNPYDSENPGFYMKLKVLKMTTPKVVSGVVSDKSSFVGKLRYFNMIMSLSYKILGYRRYISLIRLMKYFSKYESQIFLLNKKYIDSNIDILNK